MSSDQEKSPELSFAVLDRYLAGECTPAERAQVEAWMLKHPEEGADPARLRDVLRRSTPRPEWPDLDRMWRAIEQQAGDRVTESPATVPAPTEPRRVSRVEGRAPLGWLGRDRRSGATRWWRAAAAVVTIGAGTVAVWSAVSGDRHTMPVREFATVAGARSTVTLRDGTRLMLGPATKLRVPADFGAHSRTVELDGEAVFAVVHDARRPFVVQTARGRVQDVGTTFVVRAYTQDSTARVAVAEGEVSVGGASLRANDAATVGPSGRLTIQHEVDVTRDFGWSNGRLVFEDTPLSDALSELARTYDLKVSFADSSVAKKRVTATFTDEPLDDILSVVTRVVGARYTRHGQVVVIRGATSKVGGAGTNEVPDQQFAQRAARRPAP